ncbi:glycoside hydrolase family 30 protein [Dinghuibacter silviterrae]|uniref:Glucosylceramidase n=1 Tax=Dinghuibacter silviterrae TaxID=1539049 RepID=A0A4R8DVE5_9BACT|nr:glycoside hydrolase family 30 beta sandwich domain-containing protein [Dinghuibacter silviterrae]TDX01161.1 glucosylceramidase [Dinghuibacter silviterrae]
MKKQLIRISVLCVWMFIGYSGTVVTGCGKKSSPQPPPVTPPDTSGKTAVATQVSFWLTNGDQSALLAKQNVALNFGGVPGTGPSITVDSTTQYQSIDGFGFCLTGGSADLIYRMDPTTRTSLLHELFGSDSNSIGISYLRVTIGASDLSSSAYSYDDVGNGQTDTTLSNFNLLAGDVNVVPVLQMILAINPNIKILACPWSAPAWMKTNQSTSGGSLLPQYYQVYANYFVKYIQAMKAQGIHIDAITPQNEPLNANNNPAMVVQAVTEDTLVRFYLGPTFAANGIATKIIVWDHNCDVPTYPETIFEDTATDKYVDGSAWHFYAGSISALSVVHNAFPGKNVYFTEFYTASTGDFAADLAYHLKNIIIGSTQNWSRNALEWNLASDPNYQPHTQGGCSTCKGALTIGTSVTRNVSYYIIAHASKFVLPGSVRISSGAANNLNNVAFLRPDGKKVLIVENDNTGAQTFNIQFNGKWVSTSLNGGSVGTYVW